jgi:alanine racemase
VIAPLRWAEIDLGAVRSNVALIAGHLPKGTHVYAVVKAAGYGHGAVPVARAALEGGANGLAVATIEEANELRQLCPAEHILVMGGLTKELLPAAAATGCAIGVSSRETIRVLGDRDEVVPVHLKIDTGMRRFGCAPEEAPELAKLIDESSGLRLAGTWTHFASSESDEEFTRRQFDLFLQTLARFDVDPGLRHASNSRGALLHPEMSLDGVRAGIAVYGCEWPGTKPVLSYRSVVTHVKTVARGETVGYGATWRAPGAARIATVAVGYADGVFRARSNRGDVLVRGRRAPVVGTVSMDAITVDVTEVPDSAVGDVVTLIGADGEERITAEEVAAWSGTISYEVLTSIGHRVERRRSE